MHILDCYSLNCGLKIREPFIYERFFPLNVDKYITLDTSSTFPSRQYDYWSEVLNILIPILESENIKVLHISGNGESYDKVYNLCGQSSFSQMAYIIKGGLLHLGIDGFPNHLASHFNKKIVSLFGESPPENNAPVFSNKEDMKFIYADRGDYGFSYSAEEKPKSVNLVKPEEIAKAVCDSLGVEFNYNFKTLIIGDRYTEKSIELVPQGNTIDPKGLNVDSLIIRMDIGFNEQALIKQLQLNKCSIITDKPINLKILQHFRSNIVQFVYLIGDSDSKQYVEQLFEAGIQCLLMTEKNGKELEVLKFKYLDFGKIHQRKQSAKPKELEGLDLNNVYYKSSKYLIFNGSVFLSDSSRKNNDAVNMVGSSDFKKVVDEEDFWKESDLFYFCSKA